MGGVEDSPRRAEARPPDAILAPILAALEASRKYRDVAPPALERVAREALRRSRSEGEALKRAKRKLHQVCAAFVDPRALARVERRMAALESELHERGAAAIARSGRDAVLRAACREVLALHASTRERLAGIETFHRAVFALTGAPRRLLDLGCGLHPFALPWMGLPDDCEYVAADLDRRALALVHRFFASIARSGAVHAIDLLGRLPREVTATRADVAFLLKLLPTLERQEEGAAARLLDAIDARFLVVSFPTASLGRREKGMAAGYARFARALLEPRGTIEGELAAARELVYVVRTSRASISGSGDRRP